MLYLSINLSTGQIIADKIEIAADFKSRSIGLLKRVSLNDGQGLLINPCSSIHTFFMKFPIDVVFLDRQGKVLKICQNLPPWRLSSGPFGTYMTLELKTGTLAKQLVRVRDTLSFRELP